MKKCWEVFWRFLLLGCVSFGGPAAHIGYFHRTFVTKLNWIDESAYSNLLSLSQVLPGPGSSQLGFALGMHRAGLAGALAAFIGFTLPSFLLMYWLAVSTNLSQVPLWLDIVISGLKLCAVVVVFDAVVTMFGHFCKTKALVFIALMGAALSLLFPYFHTQLLVILIAGFFGTLVTTSSSEKAVPSNLQQKIYWLPLGVFCLLFILSVSLSQSHLLTEIFATFYKNGSLVFGGGHVVLPLLQNSLGEALTEKQLLVGYAAAQGIPGPMFTMATFMGAQWLQSTPLLGATLATLGIFLPGFLLVLTFNQSWQELMLRPKFIGASTGVNAAVVGLLVAAFYQPVFTNSIHNYLDVTLAVVGLICIRWFKVPIIALIGMLISFRFVASWLA